ncbi:patatin-like phospholipase family protein [Caballeronia jiangsuensis]|uniref:Patatin-like phospholipase family protein n=1 Tax=Caballeronia jiangsuensis TaxID=1458357 RepID=A0ABW9CR79_9BURK
MPDERNESESDASGAVAAKICPYVRSESPPAEGTFEIGIVLAGAISAGAYSSGVMDFLIEALDAWEAAKEAERKSGKPQKEWSVPPHDVVLRVFAGASAGSMTAAIAAVALRYDFPHVDAGSAPAQDKSANPFYRAWVQDIDIRELLKSDDLAKQGTLVSLLDSTVLQDITNRALDYTATAKARPYLRERTRFIFSQASLRGVPYYLPIESTYKAGLGMWMHKSYRSFAASYTDAVPRARPDDEILSGINNSSTGAWKSLGNAALGSGAFPVGLAAREENRRVADLNYHFFTYIDPATKQQEFKPLLPAWDAQGNTTAAPKFFKGFVVDGGTMDNEPLDFARTELAGQIEQNPRGGNEAIRAVVMIDPFPDTLAEVNDTIAGERGDLFSSSIGLIGAWKNQARFDPADLALAFMDDVYSRYLIAPSRRTSPTDPRTETNGFDLASGCLGGFGGFLSEEFRRHDYLLGRRNCQQFLSQHFSMPDTNPLYGSWSDAVRTEWHASGGELPIIPLVGKLREEIPLPKWPTQPVELTPLRQLLEARVMAVAGSALDMFKVSWIERKAASLGIALLRKKLLGYAMDKVLSDLGKRNLPRVR